MKDCNKYIKKMFAGLFILVLIFINPLWEYSSLLAVTTTIILWLSSLIYVLPYFRCYGKTLRKDLKK
ncbi:MAG: Unknown protein [uncultured Sulfurovum sp.]|uniref:Uncharacterized protein n=1 Tax=uncultured Sulfurovum sp. TaxID=269237 RepID=A0A6S6U127_9BACT|nr:MAG: Unknown protein [uncultured Sulfurovum sp.]